MKTKGVLLIVLACLIALTLFLPWHHPVKHVIKNESRLPMFWHVAIDTIIDLPPARGLHVDAAVLVIGLAFLFFLQSGVAFLLAPSSAEKFMKTFVAVPATIFTVVMCSLYCSIGRAGLGFYIAFGLLAATMIVAFLNFKQAET